jgi:DNA-binding transcriptional ArsR family regulator
VTKVEPDQVVAALAELQRLVQKGEPIPPEESAMCILIEEELARPEAETLLLGDVEAAAFYEAKARIEGDLRLEHLGGRIGDPLRRQLVRFVTLCALEPDQDHVADFLAEHSKEPEDRICFLGVEFLEVEDAVEVLGLRLLPTDHDEIPRATSWFSTDPPVRSVAAVSVTGTHLARMKDRAAAAAERALRAVRVGLRGERAINPLQLRFRLSESYSFDGDLAGFGTRPDARWALTLDRDLMARAAAARVAELAREPDSDLGRHAARATAWIEESMIEGDPMKSLLFSFFALEAMLGVRSEGPKGHGIAYRRALLSYAVRGSFPDPDAVYFLYDRVRSTAVHGEDPPEVPEREQGAFLFDVRLALEEYLELAREKGFETRRAVLKFLRELPEREQLDEWLAEFGDDSWRRFLGVRRRSDREAAEVARALGHPIRLGYLRALSESGTDGLLSPSEYARESGEPLGNVSYHVTTLAAAGIVEVGEMVARRGATEHRYSLTGPRAKIAATAMNALAGG